MGQIQYRLAFYITLSIEELSLCLWGKEQIEGSFATSSRQIICEVNPGPFFKKENIDSEIGWDGSWGVGRGETEGS